MPSPAEIVRNYRRTERCLHIGWDEVERVDFDHGMSLDFRLRDADSVVRRAAPRPWRRWQARQHRGVLSIPAVQLREPIGEVVAKARALHSAAHQGEARRAEAHVDHEVQGVA